MARDKPLPRTAVPIGFLPGTAGKADRRKLAEAIVDAMAEAQGGISGTSGTRRTRHARRSRLLSANNG